MEIAPDLVRLAVDALEAPLPPDISIKNRKVAEARRLLVAHACARAVDWTAFEWYWLEGGLEWDRRDRLVQEVYEDRKAAPNIPMGVKHDVLERDGWRCRYCRLRVISPRALTALEKALPAALPVGRTDFGSHRMQCVLRLSWDHIKARSVGGTNETDNIVVSCGACNYNKGSNSLEELRLRSPLDRDVIKDAWDGLNGRLGARPDP